MTGDEIREAFLQFFAGKGHKILPSASLIPVNDPSILWTAAGMVPFKPYFTGSARPEFLRAATCQKCLRTPDIESVGKTARHHTFFEMLGNFSFGDYFKESAIPWAWEFVTGRLELLAEKLWITVYQDDDEAFEIWRHAVGVPAERIVRMGKDTNFWEIGVGPCGPCSEIYVDLGAERGCGSPDCGVGCDCDRYLEIWNLVFIQFNRDKEGRYSPLDQKGIDTGMGLERVASVLQKVPSNFDTDLFRGVMDFTAGILGLRYGVDDHTDMVLKIIADHSRAITFAISDGALPSNEGRGYVIRRLLRRAARYGRLLGMNKLFLSLVADTVIQLMSKAYPELQERREHVLQVVGTEEERFSETLTQGTDILTGLISEARARGETVIAGKDAFKLYDTYGFPLELTQEIAAENGFTVDTDGFAIAMEEQRQRARSARSETEYLSGRDALYRKVRADVTVRVGIAEAKVKILPTEVSAETNEIRFVGYGLLSSEAAVLALLKQGERVEAAAAGEEIELVLDVTPFYAESGGQVGDRGMVTAPGLEVEVSGVIKPVEGLYVHRGKVKKGLLKVNDRVLAQVDVVRRLAASRNHSATHLLHRALKEVLGEHVNQSGSLVEPERLRFDFSHYAAVGPDALKKIEKKVNQAILSNLPVETFETSLAEARSLGAAALFGEKYGEKVRVVKMGDYSLELCGGTHVRTTAEVGLFKLTGESSIGAGLRRVEAVTGEGALRHINNEEEQLIEAACLLKASPQEVTRRLAELLRALKELETENETLQARLAGFQVAELVERVREIKGVKVLAGQVSASDLDSLRGMTDLLRDRLGSGVVVLGSAVDNKVNLVASSTKDLLARGVHAGKLVKEVAAVVGGGGGGRPEMAQAGGKDLSRLPEALEKAYAVVEAQLSKG
ncbi:MAG: alanine--tRNA ligase [Peptococcaceae bacterium]|nr:MAG: alanine--tRNA ligase [Peptococcaceae bacterium]